MVTAPQKISTSLIRNVSTLTNNFCFNLVAYRLVGPSHLFIKLHKSKDLIIALAILLIVGIKQLNWR